MRRRAAKKILKAMLEDGEHWRSYTGRQVTRALYRWRRYASNGPRAWAHMSPYSEWHG